MPADKFKLVDGLRAMLKEYGTEAVLGVLWQGVDGLAAAADGEDGEVMATASRRFDYVIHAVSSFERVDRGIDLAGSLGVMLDTMPGDD